MSDSAAVPTGRKRGRRPVDSGTRAAILDSARRLFGEAGFVSTTIRAIAADADVDPALVMQFYGSKADLFAAVLASSSEVPQRLHAAFTGDLDGIGERLARTYLDLWADPETATVLQAIFRSAVASPEAAALLREFIGSAARDVASTVPVERAEVRVTLAMAQLFGTAVARHVIEVYPLSALAREDLVRLLAPGLQALLTGHAPGHP